MSADRGGPAVPVAGEVFANRLQLRAREAPSPCGGAFVMRDVVIMHP